MAALSNLNAALLSLILRKRTSPLTFLRLEGKRALLSFRANPHPSFRCLRLVPVT